MVRVSCKMFSGFFFLNFKLASFMADLYSFHLNSGMVRHLFFHLILLPFLNTEFPLQDAFSLI